MILTTLLIISAMWARSGYSTQHALLRFVEKCRETINKRGFSGAIFKGLSKVFDSLNHELLTAKLDAYGFDKSALKRIFRYLKNRKQRVTSNESHSAWKTATVGAPQGSVLGPHLFNVFINYLFSLEGKTILCNYADDTTIYACGSTKDLSM